MSSSAVTIIAAGLITAAISLIAAALLMLWGWRGSNGVIASIAHLAYHFGAVRQIDRSIRGPLAG